MHPIAKIASLLSPLVLVCALVACSGGNHNDSSSSSLITIGTQCDAGASINPTSVRVNSGDTPAFDISLQSGYGIQTIICNTGGSLVGTHFTMGAVSEADTVHVVTQGRSVGSAAVTHESPQSEKKISGDKAVKLESLNGTACVSSRNLAMQSVVVGVHCADASARLYLRHGAGSSAVLLPLAYAGGKNFEAQFLVGDMLKVNAPSESPSMLVFDIIATSQDENLESASPLGRLFVAVK